MRNIMYFKNVNSIGGVETFVYTLSKKYNFEFYYKEGDPIQIERLAKNIKVRKYKGEKLVCDKFLVNYNPDIIDNVEAKEYIMMIHCDYSGVVFKPFIHPKFTKYIGVSKYVSDVFTNMTGIPAETCYNPIDIEIPKVKKKEGLHIIYAGRLTSEKNGVLIDRLREKLDKAGVNYDLTIYTNQRVFFDSPNVIIKAPKLDLTKEMAEATFTLITSKHEAYCFSAVESLVLGTPLICTDLPVFKEIGIDDTNSIKINDTLKDFNIEDLYKKFDFVYKPPKDNWSKYLDKDKNYNPNDSVKVKCIKNKLTDMYEKKDLKLNEEYKTVQWRASFLEAKGYVEICE